MNTRVVSDPRTSDDIQLGGVRAGGAIWGNSSLVDSMNDLNMVFESVGVYTKKRRNILLSR